MKNFRTMKRLLLSLFLLSGLVSCKKEPFDFRNKYLGYYDFTVEVSSHDIPTGAPYSYTEPYVGEVTYGSRGNTVNIRYLIDNTIEPTMDKSGVLTFTEGFEGEFESKKKVRFTYNDGGNPEKRYVVTGIKQ